MVDLVVGQGRGGLVQNEEFRVHIEGAADFQQLLAGFQPGHHGGGVDVHTQVVKKLPGPGHLLPLAQQAELGQLPAQKDVVCHRQVVDYIQLLVDKGDARRLHLLDGGGGVTFAVEGDGAGVGRDYAG